MDNNHYLIFIFYNSIVITIGEEEFEPWKFSLSIKTF